MTEVRQVFLSHSSEDKAQVRKLAEDLTRAGIAVWYDEAEIKIGDSITEKVNEGLKFRTTLEKLTERPPSLSIWALTAQELRANRYMLTIFLNPVEWMLTEPGEKS